MRRRLLAAIATLVLSCPALAQSAGPQDAERSFYREQVWRIPAAGGAQLMVATVMRPPGEARSPLVVINHGSPTTNSGRHNMQRQRFPGLGSWFAARGYVVVLPMRRGYGETGGAWAENYGPCEAPDFVGAGLEGAADIRAAIDYMRGQPFVAAERTIVVGQSAGGWATVALSSLNPPGVPAMISFAGGRSAHQKLPDGTIGNCAPDALLEAAATYGATARLPMLWIYTENDSYFAPSYARRLADAYNGAGGRADFHAVGPNGRDGHNLVRSADGAAIWAPLIEDFLAAR